MDLGAVFKGAVPPGAVTMWLACPRCDVMNMVFWKGFDDFEYIKCPGCDVLSRTSAWKILALDYKPEPTKAPRPGKTGKS